ncbi:ricin-type beta-trefoil lectin domain protein [Kineosporia babensis]|uniref:Ricin-type beta-trefoil lectin domain protein n=1 Tax=Kineosporia babensis TaxID=499548 RepID=A0A9X1NAJ6_9ACTN|nr:ricin-type beta-trefoil lectin domain protein [Kineosporia babensis]
MLAVTAGLAAVVSGTVPSPISNDAAQSAPAQADFASDKSKTPPADLLSDGLSGQKAGTPIPGSYVVRLADRPGLRRAKLIQAATDRLTSEFGGTATYVYTAALRGFSARMSAGQAKQMAADPDVASVTEDVVMTSLAVETQSPAPWHLDRLDQNSLPLSGTYDYEGGGAGANIFVLDTGVRTSHQEFGGRAKPSGPNPEDAQDCAGHGTAVGGAAAGSTYGVAKQATLYGIRVLDCDGTGPKTGGLQAIDWITKNAPRPAVVNLSWGTSGQDDLDAAIRNSIKAGVTYVIAAGNSNENACTGSPARVEEAIVVGASDQQDNRAGFSSYGSCLDIFAPGTDIQTASYDSDTSTTTSGGTSLSAPIVAGAVALHQAANPSDSPAQVLAALKKCSAGEVGNPGPGSPNELLGSRCQASGPALANPGRQSTAVGQEVDLDVRPENAADSVRYGAQGLPSGLSMNATSGKITGAAAAGAKSSMVTLTATGPAGTTTQTLLWDVVLGMGNIKGINGECWDAPSSNTDDGNQLQLWECNHKWVAATDGTITFSENPSACVTDKDGRIETWRCDGSAAQVWQARDGQLVNPASGRCVSVPNSGWGTKLTTAACTDHAGQQWQLPTGMNATITLDTPGDQITVRGERVSKRVTARSSDTTQTFRYAAEGLPEGLSINASTGLISGTSPKPQATSTVGVTATSRSGESKSATFTWKVTDGQITGPADLCVDNWYGKTDNGNPIAVFWCNDGGTQQWTEQAGGTLEIQDKCMTVDGSKVVLGECAGAKTWEQQSNGTLALTGTARCLTAPDLNGGTPFEVADCSTSENQKWRLPNTTGTPEPDPEPTTPSPEEPEEPEAPEEPEVPEGAIVHASKNWCADVRDDVVGLWDCNDTPPQKFTLTEEGRVLQGEACMTPAADSSGVNLKECSVTDATQEWKQAGDGTVRNPASGLCLTAKGLGYIEPFVLADCTGADTQLWALPGA